MGTRSLRPRGNGFDFRGRKRGIALICCSLCHKNPRKSKPFPRGRRLRVPLKSSMRFAPPSFSFKRTFYKARRVARRSAALLQLWAVPQSNPFLQRALRVEQRKRKPFLLVAVLMLFILLLNGGLWWLWTWLLTTPARELKSFSAPYELPRFLGGNIIGGVAIFTLDVLHFRGDISVRFARRAKLAARSVGRHIGTTDSFAATRRTLALALARSSSGLVAANLCLWIADFYACGIHRKLAFS